jgi:hypothetical protein
MTGEKSAECAGQLDECLDRIRVMFRDKLRKSDFIVPAEWLDVNDYRLSLAILDSICRERPFRFFADDNAANADNLHWRI